MTINWIPGHKGHIGNETADYLAKLGGELNPPVAHKHCISTNRINYLIKTLIKEEIIKRWNNTKISNRATDITTYYYK